MTTSESENPEAGGGERRKQPFACRLTPPAKAYLEALATDLAHRAYRSRSVGETLEYVLLKHTPTDRHSPEVHEAHAAFKAAFDARGIS